MREMVRLRHQALDRLARLAAEADRLGEQIRAVHLHMKDLHKESSRAQRELHQLIEKRAALFRHMLRLRTREVWMRR
jgi:hypothetical protein